MSPPANCPEVESICVDQGEEQRFDDVGWSWTWRALQQFVVGQQRHRDDIGGIANKNHKEMLLASF